MEKQKKRFTIKELDWKYGIEVSKLREDLDEVEKLGATHIEIDASVFYDCAELTIEAECERFETDEEFNFRIDKNKRYEESTKKRELEQLGKLRLKYGK